MRKLSNIQVLRGLAALAVVVFHAREEVDAFGITTRWPGLFGGAFGVDVFFVISGFVMVYASVPLFGTARSAWPFIGKRLARIVPLYWATTLLFAALDYREIQDGMGHLAFARFLGTSLGFVPYLAPTDENAFPLYPLGWTLDYEMAFYVSFALVLGLRRPRAIAVLATAFSALVILGRAVPLPAPLAYLASSQILEFVAGMILAELALSGRRLHATAAWGLIAAGLAAMLAAAPWSDAWWGTWRGIVWGLPAAAVVGAVALSPPRATVGLVRRWFERLGDASYALYLVHYGLFVAVESLFGGRLGELPASVLIGVLVALAVGASLVVHHGFERPVTRWLQRRAAPGGRRRWRWRKADPGAGPVRDRASARVRIGRGSVMGWRSVGLTGEASLRLGEPIDQLTELPTQRFDDRPLRRDGGVEILDHALLFGEAHLQPVDSGGVVGHVGLGDGTGSFGAGQSGSAGASAAEGRASPA